jgi:hypothetical protein
MTKINTWNKVLLGYTDVMLRKLNEHTLVTPGYG